VNYIRKYCRVKCTSVKIKLKVPKQPLGSSVLLSSNETRIGIELVCGCVLKPQYQNWRKFWTSNSVLINDGEKCTTLIRIKHLCTHNKTFTLNQVLLPFSPTTTINQYKIYIHIIQHSTFAPELIHPYQAPQHWLNSTSTFRTIKKPKCFTNLCHDLLNRFLHLYIY
jgi:hypothetical protein